MPYGFLDIASTSKVKAAQAKNGSGDYWRDFTGERTFDRFTENEAAFIAERDNFYMATVSESGWPYIQHRGGPSGFLRVLNERMLGFADFRGNRQYISIGNLAASDRVSLILMDYAGRRRLKIYAHAEIKEVSNDPELRTLLTLPGYKAVVERAILLHLKAFDWNCPQHIIPRFTETELAIALEPVRQRLAELEAENKKLRQEAAESQNPSGA